MHGLTNLKIVDTVDGAKPRELQTLARFSEH